MSELFPDPASECLAVPMKHLAYLGRIEALVLPLEMPDNVVLLNLLGYHQRVIPHELNEHRSVIHSVVAVVSRLVGVVVEGRIPSEVDARHVEVLRQLVGRVQVDVKQTCVQVAQVEVGKHGGVKSDLH